MKQVNLKLVKTILPILFGLFFSMGVFAQQITVKGTVKDVNGEPIIGANISVKGTSNGTVSDIDGNFSFQAPKGATLVVKFVGYKQITAVAGPAALKVILEEDAVMVSDIIVVGYATGSQKTISGSVQKVGREGMNAGVVSNPLAALKGKVAGVNISKVGGDPTAGTSIRVRGTTSLTGGNDPLIIIDGVFGDLNMLNAISSADIENFTILKDASETAQYGSRGASGVIVVTTTKGKFGTKTLSYDGTFGVESIYKNLKMLSADQFRAAGLANGISILDKGNNTDFIKEMQQTGYIQTHRVSFGAGTEGSNYRVSLGVVDQKGVIKNNSMTNYTAKFDATQLMFNNKLKLEFGIFGSKKKSNFINDYQKTFYSAASYNPTYPNFKNSDGVWDENANANEVQNPLGRLDIKDVEDNAYLNTNARLTWTIINDLKLTAFGSYTYNVKENSKYIPRTIKAGMSSKGEASKYDNKAGTLLGNLMLNYKKKFDKHYIDVLGLAEVQKYTYTGFGAASRRFATDFFEYNNLGGGADVKYGDVSSYIKENSIASFLGRFNYIYADKYIATVNARTDGSSKLGANNKWGFFPSASVAWVMSKEGFMQDVKAINNLKFRAGYGLTGNQDAIEPYQSLSLLETGTLGSIGGVPYAGGQLNRNPNPDLKWEIKKMFNAGFDLGLLNDRYTVSMDVYSSRTDNLLYTYLVLNPPFKISSMLANLGSMRNDGIELAIGATPIKTKDIELTINANASYQKNKITSLSGTYQGEPFTTSEYVSLGGMNGAGFIGGYNKVVYQKVGKPVGFFYLPKCTGLVDNGFGEYTYGIANLDGQPGIDLKDGKDRYDAGQAIPKIFMGTNIMFRYKSFDIQTQLNGAFGHKIYNGTSLSYMNMSQFPTYNVMASAPSKNIKDQTVTDYWLEKGDYVNIDYVTLGWNMNIKSLKKYINKMRMTLSVNNIYTFTNYSGLSPMINSTVVNGDLGVDDKRFYPLSRTYSLGLSVNF